MRRRVRRRNNDAALVALTSITCLGAAFARFFCCRCCFCVDDVSLLLRADDFSFAAAYSLLIMYL